MIDQADIMLKAWAQEIVRDATVSLASPANAPDGHGVSLYLLELLPAVGAGNGRRAPLLLNARYLVTSWAEDIEQAHRLLGELVFAAMEQPEFDVDLEPPPVSLWTALGAMPRPAFLLRVPVRLERPAPPVKLVRRPLVLRTVPVAPLNGVVLGPEGVPLANARVEFPYLQLSALTNAQGAFRFAGIPGEAQQLALRVSARGQVQDYALDWTPGAGEPLTIRFALKEG